MDPLYQDEKGTYCYVFIYLYFFRVKSAIESIQIKFSFYVLNFQL